MIIGFIFACLSASVSAGEARGEQVYVNVDQFLASSLGSNARAATFWPKNEVRKQLADILGHAPSLRFRYWGAEGKTVWIMDEIGKDRPITAGVLIDHGAIADIKVLVFRESRGWEVKHDFFTRQFENLRLNRNHRLTRQVDNITGATLSVNAMTRMARAALLMHEHTDQATGILATAR